jgi:hypothetical protein
VPGDTFLTVRRRREAPAVKRKGRTKAQVKDKLREVVEDLAAGVTAAEGYTVQDAINDFLDQGMKGKSPETVSNYLSLASHHLMPYLGAARLKKLTADELDTWMDGRAADDPGPGGPAAGPGKTRQPAPAGRLRGRVPAGRGPHRGGPRPHWADVDLDEGTVAVYRSASSLPEI